MEGSLRLKGGESLILHHLILVVFLGTFQGLARGAEGTEDLWITIGAKGGDVSIHAQVGPEVQEFKIQGGHKDVKGRFDQLYHILQEKVKKDLPTFRGAVADLSQKISAPLAGLFAKSKHVVFQIDKDFVRAPLDLLEVDGKPIFLTHEVTYAVSKFKLKKSMPKIETGYLMADLTCDPEFGLKAVAKTLPKATYVEMKDANLKTIKKAAKNSDILVISAHGEIDKKNSGGISINKEELDSDFIKKLDVNLTYFDSCQMGAAWDFVKEFRDNQTSIYYTAPIISNDAGDSSTRTVTWFFELLNEGQTPAAALAATRRRLYDFYKNKNLDDITVLNKAFPFRLYEFDQR